jgi:hypothetical protein
MRRPPCGHMLMCVGGGDCLCGCALNNAGLKHVPACTPLHGINTGSNGKWESLRLGGGLPAKHGPWHSCSDSQPHPRCRPRRRRWACRAAAAAPSSARRPRGSFRWVACTVMLFPLCANEAESASCLSGVVIQPCTPLAPPTPTHPYLPVRGKPGHPLRPPFSQQPPLCGQPSFEKPPCPQPTPPTKTTCARSPTAPSCSAWRTPTTLTTTWGATPTT